MNNTRTKIETRRNSMSNKEKEYILSKSHRKCCRCGINLSINDGYTTDHFIPLSKGGTEDIENYIALCKNCNSVKADYVVNPLTYCNYLSPHYLKEVCDVYEEYCDKFTWTTLQNYLKEELLFITYKVNLPSMKGYKKHSKGIEKDNATALLVKVKKEELPEIYDYVKKYNSQYNLEKSDKGVKEIVDKFYENGCFYMLKNKAKEIIALFPITIDIMYFKNLPYYNFHINGLPVKYKKIEYYELIHKVIYTLTHSLCEPLNSNNKIVFTIAWPKDDDYLRIFFSNAEGYYPVYKDDSNIASTICFWNTDDNSENTKPTSKELRIFSDSISKTFNLQPINYAVAETYEERMAKLNNKSCVESQVT